MANEKKAKETSHGLNTAGKVLGILSIVFAAIFISAPLGLFLGIIGLILAIIYKAKGGEKSSGLVLTIIGTAISIFMMALLILTVGTFFTILTSGMIGDWECETSRGAITSVSVNSDGYVIDGERVDFDDLKFENLKVTADDDFKEMSVTFRSDDTIYTCTKH